MVAAKFLNLDASSSLENAFFQANFTDRTFFMRDIHRSEAILKILSLSWSSLYIFKFVQHYWILRLGQYLSNGWKFLIRRDK